MQHDAGWEELMAGELHAISQAIGQLQATAEESQRQTATLFAKVEEVQRQVAGLGSVVETVKAMKPEVEDWTRTKNKALGAIAFLSCVAAVMGAVGDWLAAVARGLLK